MTPVDDVGRELIALFRELKALHSQVLVDVGVRVEMPATAVLTLLDERGQQRPSTLADALHIDLSTVSRQVAALEREGWVTRERDPEDSRALLLDLTDEGRRVLTRVRSVRTGVLRERLAGWSDDELQAFAAQLERLRTDIQAPALVGEDA